MKDYPTSFRLPRETVEALDALAKRRKRTRAQVLQELIEEAAARDEVENLRARVEALEAEVARLKTEGATGILLTGT